MVALGVSGTTGPLGRGVAIHMIKLTQTSENSNGVHGDFKTDQVARPCQTRWAL
jgi:hypothetical protein